MMIGIGTPINQSSTARMNTLLSLGFGESPHGWAGSRPLH